MNNCEILVYSRIITQHYANAIIIVWIEFFSAHLDVMSVILEFINVLDKFNNSSSQKKKRLVVFHCSSHNSKPDPTVETLGSVYKQNEMDKRKNERKNDFYVFNEISALMWCSLEVTAYAVFDSTQSKINYVYVITTWDCDFIWNWTGHQEKKNK